MFLSLIWLLSCRLHYKIYDFIKIFWVLLSLRLWYLVVLSTLTLVDSYVSSVSFTWSDRREFFFFITDHRKSLKGTLRTCLASPVPEAGSAIPDLLSTVCPACTQKPATLASLGLPYTNYSGASKCLCIPSVSSKLPQLHFKLLTYCPYHNGYSERFIPFLFAITFHIFEHCYHVFPLPSLLQA